MPTEDGIGYSDYTKLKIEHLDRILAMHLAITQAVLEKNRFFSQQYRYIDLTSGKGGSPEAVGSPIVFLNHANSAKFRLPFRADFIEQYEDNLATLQETLAKNDLCRHASCYFHHSSYEEKIPQLLVVENPIELGLVFVDPSGNLPDFDTLGYIARMRPKMEILIYIAATNIKRVFPYKEKLLSDYMRELGKDNWLIRKPIRKDKHQWTFLLGSNSNLFSDYKRIDFFRLESKEAQQFFPKLNLSSRQRLEQIQPRLPLDGLD